MQDQRNAIKAGIFIVVCGILVLVVMFSITGFSGLRENMVQRGILFKLTDNVGGLRIGDDVRIGGLKIGTVRNIDVQSDGSGNDAIIVVVQMPARYRVASDAVARIESTFTGVSVINFERLGTGDVLPADVALVGRGSQLSEILGQFREAAPDVRIAVGEAAGLMRDIRSQTVPAANNTVNEIGELASLAKRQIDPEQEKTIGASARTMLDEFALLSSDTRPDFRSTMANLNSFSGNLKEKLPGLLDNLDGQISKVGTTLDQVNQTLAELHTTVVNARDVSATARSVIVRNQSRFQGMVESLKTTADNLKGASAEIRRSPWRLLYRPRAGEVANLNIYDTARQFAEGASQLDEAVSALRDAAQDPRIDEKRLNELMQHVEDRFKQFREVEDALWKNVKE